MTLDTRHCIALGHFFAERPRRYGSLVKMAGLVNDAQIAFGAISIGPPPYTEDKDHFEIIRNVLQALKVKSVRPVSDLDRFSFSPVPVLQP